LNEAFMPLSSLSKVFDVSVARAQVAKALMAKASGEGHNVVDASEFFLNEAMAQLQLGLFGMDAEFDERTNEPLRKVFAGTFGDRQKGIEFLGGFALELIKEMKEGTEEGRFTKPNNQSGVTVTGPVSNIVSSNPEDMETTFGNALIFAFAGHDTTGHTMTWLTYELARHPACQRKVQEEADAMFTVLVREQRQMEYRDCRLLPYLSRCIAETLRLWPAVPNGTFREIQYDDYCQGENGEQVKLPKGTYVQVATLMRHRNPELWGDDVLEFNPDREFETDEVWGGDAFQGYNPSTKRYSPFTYPPRDCMGKNFAQMEMRTILSHIYSSFTFELAAGTAEVSREAPVGEVKQAVETGGGRRHINMGVNRGTMGPRNYDAPKLQVTEGETRVQTGLHVRAIPRQRK